MSKFTVSLVLDYEFTETSAIHILSDPSPKHALQQYMEVKHGVAGNKFVGVCNSEYLARGLGEYLAQAKITEAKQIPLSTGGGTE